MPVRSASVETSAGRVAGRAGAYLGIPYATAPRWRPPGPPEPWAGVREATTFGPPAPQPARPISAFAHGAVPPGDEDCLTLNVWTPASGEGPWPVLVWAIGGGWTIGWTGSGLYDGGMLADALEAVVVTLTYRLGSLGWAYHPDLGGGNWGLLDHVAALEWVRENIAGFGGDPERVTLGGQSAGAANVADLLVAPAGEGLFARAVLHSPPLVEAANDPQRGARWTTELRARLPADPSAQDIVDAHEALLGEGEWRGTRGAAWPTLDAATLPVSPLDEPAARLQVPVLVGTTRDEATFLFRTGGRRLELDMARLHAMVAHMSGVDDPGAVIARHTAPGLDAEALLVRIVTAELFTVPTLRWARERAAAGGDVHVFRIDHPSPDPRLGALHTICVPLLFGTFRTSEVARHYVDDDAATRAVSAEMQLEWRRFLHGEDPGWAPGDARVFGSGDSF